METELLNFECSKECIAFTDFFSVNTWLVELQ